MAKENKVKAVQRELAEKEDELKQHEFAVHSWQREANKADPMRARR